MSGRKLWRIIELIFEWDYCLGITILVVCLVAIVALSPDRRVPAFFFGSIALGTVIGLAFWLRRRKGL